MNNAAINEAPTRRRRRGPARECSRTSLVGRTWKANGKDSRCASRSRSERNTTSTHAPTSSSAPTDSTCEAARPRAWCSVEKMKTESHKLHRTRVPRRRTRRRTRGDLWASPPPPSRTFRLCGAPLPGRGAVLRERGAEGRIRRVRTTTTTTTSFTLCADTPPHAPFPSHASSAGLSSMPPRCSSSVQHPSVRRASETMLAPRLGATQARTPRSSSSSSTTSVSAAAHQRLTL